MTSWPPIISLLGWKITVVVRCSRCHWHTHTPLAHFLFFFPFFIFEIWNFQTSLHLHTDLFLCVFSFRLKLIINFSVVFVESQKCFHEYPFLESKFLMVFFCWKNLLYFKHFFSSALGHSHIKWHMEFVVVLQINKHKKKKKERNNKNP